MAQKSDDYADKIKFRREMIVGRHKLDVCEFYKNIFTVEDVTIWAIYETWSHLSIPERINILKSNDSSLWIECGMIF